MRGSEPKCLKWAKVPKVFLSNENTYSLIFINFSFVTFSYIFKQISQAKQDKSKTDNFDNRDFFKKESRDKKSEYDCKEKP